MALKKIISGGQVGANQAALDAAIKYTFPHGGWIQKGRKTKSGVLPHKYRLEEMSVSGYKERIEQNVISSDGMVIISRGDLSGGAAYAQQMTNRHNRPCLQIDLHVTPVFIAASKINTWILNNSIEVLNVTGSRTSEDMDVYKDTYYIIEGTILLALVNAKPGDHLADYDRKELLDKLPIPPKTVDEAVDRLMLDLDLEDKVKIAKADFNELINIHLRLKTYLKTALGVWHGNKELLADCRSISEGAIYNEEQATFVIVKALWQRLKKTHKLRVVK